MNSTHPLLAAAVALALASCGGDDPVAAEADNIAGLPSIDNVAGARDGTPSADGGARPTPGAGPTAATPANAVPAAAIPAALHGRWGMSPGDCTSTNGNSNGLLVIGADGLRFHESRAVPVRNVETSADSISADFAFTGEGQSWTKYQALTIDDDRLVRTESSPMASFTYAFCR